MVLVNGVMGIGTGWSTFIPPYDLSSIIDIIQKKLTNPSYKANKINPWYRNFQG